MVNHRVFAVRPSAAEVQALEAVLIWLHNQIVLWDLAPLASVLGVGPRPAPALIDLASDDPRVRGVEDAEPAEPGQESPVARRHRAAEHDLQLPDLTFGRWPVDVHLGFQFPHPVEQGRHFVHCRLLRRTWYSLDLRRLA